MAIVAQFTIPNSASQPMKVLQSVQNSASQAASLEAAKTAIRDAVDRITGSNAQPHANDAIMLSLAQQAQLLFNNRYPNATLETYETAKQRLLSVADGMGAGHGTPAFGNTFRDMLNMRFAVVPAGHLQQATEILLPRAVWVSDNSTNFPLTVLVYMLNPSNKAPSAIYNGFLVQLCYAGGLCDD